MAILGCVGDTAAPKSLRPMRFSLVPVFQSRAAVSVSFDKVRIRLSRGTVPALDTTISFPPGVDSLALPLSVQISGSAETLTLDLAMIDAAGDTVFRGGPEPVTLTTANVQTALPVSVRYTGIGANAKSVRIGTKAVSVFFRDSVTLTATALDSNDVAIPGTPIAWRSLDTLVARVRADTMGRVVAGVARGLARVEAMLPTSLADTAQVTVQPVPAAIGIVSGNAQTGPVGSALSQPLVVRVKAADSLAVQGVAVNFAVGGGGGTLTKATDTTASTGNATTTWTLGSVLGAQSVTATVAGAPSITVTLGATGVVGPPKKLAFQVQPPNGSANVVLAPPVQVVAQDTFGNTVSAFTGNVTLAFGANPGAATLGGAVTVAAAAGVASFSNLTLNNPGTGYTLVASASGLTSATSAAFNVTGGIPTQLAFVQQPSNATGGAAITPPVTVQVRDVNGNLVPTATNAVTVAIGTNPGGGSLGGTKTVNAVAGVATFAGLTIDKAGAGYTLAASSGGLSGATSAAFTIAAGAATQLAFTTEPPASTSAGAGFGVVVTARDSLGNTATGFAGNVTVAITGGTGKAGAALRGTATVPAVSGVATFSALSIDSVGTGYTLTATATGLTAATSTALTVAAAPASRLVFTTQPAGATAGVGFGTVVTARDSLGNTAIGFTGNVAVAITGGTGKAGAALRGTTSVAAVAGVATFAGLSVDSAGTGYTLTASATGPANATSAAFTIAAAPASRLAFTTQPPASVLAGAGFGVVATARDSLGNTATSFTGNVTVAITGGTGKAGAALRGTTSVAAAAGVATFAGLSVDSAGAGYTLTASATGPANGTSAAFSVGSAPAARLAFTTQPLSTTAGTGFGVSVTARDSLGNTATGFTGNVTVAITGGTGTAGAALRGTTTVAAVSGVATFSALSVDSVGAGYTLTAAATGPTSGTSATFTISAASASRLVFTTEPPASGTAGAGFGVVVTARDSLGNTAVSFVGNVTVAIAAGTGKAGAALRGTTTVAAVSGVATFSALSVDSAGTGYALTASATGPTSATSTAFTIAAAPASRLAFTTEPPASATAGAGFGVVITARDSLGNAATSFAGNVTVAITGGTGKAGAALRGTTTVAAASGVATLSGLSVDSAGTGYTLTATATGPANATSTAFDITVAPASRLAFTTEPPASAAAGAGFGVVVTARDSLGNTATGFSGTVTVAITGGTGKAGAALRGTSSVAAVAGVATFSGLSVDSVGTGYTFTASATGPTSATSTAFDVVAAPASRLAFTTEPPASAAAGAGFGAVVTARDSLGNTATGFTGNVTLAITGGTGKAGAALRGTATVAAVAGVATFAGVSIDSVGTGYTLTAGATGPTSATSSALDVTAAPASQLAFTTEPPASAAAGAAFGAVVTARDSLGNTATAFSGNVTVAITGGTGKTGAALRGTTTAAAVAGVATFSGLSIDSVGTGYTLTATATGPASATSTALDVTAAPASQLAFTTQPPASTVAGTGFGAVVTARDSLGNTASTFTGNVTLAITGGTGKAGAALRGTTTVAAVAGVATFAGVSIDSVGTGYTLTATGPASASSTALDVTAAPASRLAFTTQPPASDSVGVGFGVAVTARDSLGNVATGFAGNVSVAITGGTGTAGAALAGTTTVAAVAGVATFAGLSVDSAGSGYTLTATAAGTSNATSTAFTVLSLAPTQLAFTIEPPASVTALAPFGFSVAAKDGAGNVATGFTGVITVAIAGNPAGGTLSGTLTQSAVAGVATFTGISIDNIGSPYTLIASFPGLTSATSSAISIVAPLNVNAWINPSGGNWSVAANWSKGTVPVSTDTVQIKQSGTYVVNLNVPGTFARLDVGAPSGIQTLSVAANTLTAGNGAFANNSILALSGTGTIAGGGTLTVAGSFNWTGGNLGAVGGPVGTVQVLSGGSLNIAPSAQTQIQNYTLALGGVGTWAGTGALAITNSGNGATLEVLPGGVLTVTGDPTISQNLGGATTFDNQGSVVRSTSTNSFVVNAPISGNGDWQVVTGSINLQEGGTIGGPVTVSAGATLNFFAGAFSFGFNGPVSGAGTVNVNAGTVGFNSGYNVTGSTQITGGSAFFGGGTGSTAGLTLSAGLLGVLAPFTATGPTTWSGGTINISGGTLQLAGGSSGLFGGTATVSPGATLELAGGTFTLTSNLAVTGGGALDVTGGILVLNGFRASLTGDFGTSGTGLLKMSNALDSLGVGGNASFGGGSTAGLLTAGIITVGGNFAQSGSATSFAPSTAHRVRFSGTGPTQTVSFLAPTTSFFDSLVVDRGFSAGTIQLLTDVQVNRGVFIANSSSLTGPTARLTIAGGTLHAVQSTTSPSVTPLAIELSVPPVIGGAPVLVSPDTMVYDGGAFTTLPTGSGLKYKSVRINTTGAITSPGNVTYNGDLIVGSGTYTIGSGVDSITGFLRTEGSGAMAMVAIVAAPTVVVGDSAVFAGGPSTGLTGGTLRIRGNFVQRGAGNAFAPSSAHRVTFERSTAGVQTIQFADPVNSFFNRLTLNRPIADTVRLLSDVLANDSATVTGFTVLSSTAFEALKTPVTGTLRIPGSGAVLKPSRVEFGTLQVDSPFVGAPRIMPDTTVFLNGGGITSASPAYAWKTVRVAGGTLSSFSGTTYNGNLIISGGSYSLCTLTDSVVGFFRTEGSGVLALSCAEGEAIAIRDSAVFAGGDETGQLTGGILRVGGDFVQRGPIKTSFAASPGFSVILNGTSPAGQQIAFTDPAQDASGSHFGFLQISNLTAPVTLKSPVFVNGILADSAIAGEQINGDATTVLTTQGISVNQFTFNGAPLVVFDTAAAPTFVLEQPTFQGYDPSVDELTVRMRAGVTSASDGAVFTTSLGTGHYLNVQWVQGLSIAPVFNMNTATPAAQGGTGSVIAVTGPFGTPIINWP
jgi:hypothetical protein